MMREKSILDPGGEIEVSFGYQCSTTDGYDIPSGKKLERNNSSFSCLSGAAISANATLANTNICNGLISSEILPSLDSPKSFRRIPSSPSFTKLDLLSSSFQSGMSYLSCSPSTPENLEFDSLLSKPLSAPSRSEDFLNAVEVQVAGGAAGEDRVQAVCSEENGWLFCAIYDGFNGRDAADFLAGTFYETIRCNLNSLDMEFDYFRGDDHIGRPKNRVLDSLERSLNQAENDFLYMVEQEMEDRPDIVSVGSCVLVGLLQGKDLYIMNLGDSRAVLATDDDETKIDEFKGLKAVQLTDSHTVDNEAERKQVVSEHPDDPKTIVHGKVKGKLKVTRAFGVGYLKKKVLNDALMGILRVRNLLSPPYVTVQPSLCMHEVSSSDHFVILASDGLFDFFTNDEVVKLVHSYISRKPFGDPAKYLLEQLVLKAASSAGFSTEELMSVPAGRRRKYHDDVTVIVIILGTNKRTSKASTCI
uniref:probable protein phosphatase 2C 40 n=1 Tax=Erigeron canadensis TaxID=72917 RepID=UPI001CB994D3|nr:probable protein phosphatase 2C 40 [Erigeron canadensis]XP_043628861.1 probable protein phosphatase 2C 40 [Erigeron canadensis]XP_043628862.1 probable protein phosphatase 2C 40 [Erigeron canadensis]